MEAARRSAGLTQKAMADRLGIPLWKLELLERGEADPTPYLGALGKLGAKPEAPAPALKPEQRAGSSRNIQRLREALAQTEAENVRLEERMGEARKRLEESEKQAGRVEALLSEFRLKGVGPERDDGSK